MRHLKDKSLWPKWLQDAITINPEIYTYCDKIVWKNGIWVDGVWHGSFWENGIWLKGRWSTGTWSGGIFNSGIISKCFFNGGIINNAIIQDLFLQSGTIKNCVYDTLNFGEDGGFKVLNSTCINNIPNITYTPTKKSELWPKWLLSADTTDAEIHIDPDGTVHWLNGIWNKGTWVGGVWHNGIFKNGTWKNGIFKNGYWRNGIWMNGIFEFGYWNDGIFCNGSWMDGIFISGSYNGNKQKSIYEYDGTKINKNKTSDYEYILKSFLKPYSKSDRSLISI